MTTENDPFRGLDLKEAIDLRWSLRDIRARRWTITPIKGEHIERLQAMGLIEFVNDEPVVTSTGLSVIA